MKKSFVSILMGSDSDFPVLEGALAVFKTLQVPYEIKITSAHRTPEATQTTVKDAETRGCAVFIAAAGMAAHLAGAVAALTTKPVIGVPLEVGGLGGLDALLSTVQMPGGIPVGCMAIGQAGAKNAAYFAAEILALSDEALHKRLLAERQKSKKSITEKDKALQIQLKS